MYGMVGDRLNTGQRIIQARLDAGLSQKELAEKLNVDKGTLSNWENGSRQLTLERLVQLAELLGVKVAFLLGEDDRLPFMERVSTAILPILHWAPVWMRSRGWALVNAASATLVFPDKSEIAFAEVQEPVYVIPPAFSIGLRGMGDPLGVDEVIISDRVWVEPVITDPELAAELRGWYRPRGPRLVENEYGIRFYMDTYGAKWLAFKSCSQTGAAC